MPTAAHPRTPVPVSPDDLTRAHLYGLDCIWCSAELHTASRVEVGHCGGTRLYGCPDCAEVRRLPSWPEPGSA